MSQLPCTNCGGPRASLLAMIRATLARADVVTQIVNAARARGAERFEELTRKADAQFQAQLRTELAAALDMSADPRCCLCIIAADPTASWGHWAVALASSGITDRRAFQTALQQRTKRNDDDSPLPATISHDVSIGAARYAVKFDVRPDASVFIFVLRQWKPDGSEETPRLVARGLIDHAVVSYNEHADHQKIWTAPPAVIHELEQVLIERWEQMRQELKRRGGGWPVANQGNAE